ncbi:hypothetical protein L3X38_011193 [Prunus dulcis]|uniref:Uncharacterized protein n=1 Tax=Prunus dulcis TaxID=3755 RepID=A0AAD4WJ74_PRUDU|nr:hypothetical protein L3X38_011193 [Prunus dulcis]
MARRRQALYVRWACVSWRELARRAMGSKWRQARRKCWAAQAETMGLAGWRWAWASNMAFFKCFKKGTVTILEDESDSWDEGTTLLVGAPLLASEVSEVDNYLHILSWSQEAFYQLSSFKKSKSIDRDLHSTVLQLKSSHHTETDSLRAFELLSDRIHNGVVNWGSVLPTAAESTFTEYYWEWLEDVLSRNTQNKSQKPKEDSDPAGIIAATLKHTEEEEGVFEDLDDPGNCTTVPPFHYVYRWLGEYFDTHFTSSSEKSIPIMARFLGRLLAKFFEDSTARALFRTCGKVKMSRLAKVFSECKQLTDEDHISKEDFEYLICLRSGFVSLRQENYRVIQPYSPHWFSRQFCFVQQVPGELKDDVRNGTVLSVYSHWKSCLKIGSTSTITLPTKDNIREFEITFDYVIWWSKVHRFESTKSKTISTDGLRLCSMTGSCFAP